MHIIPKTKGEEFKIGASECIILYSKSFLAREQRTENDMAEEASKYRENFEQSIYLQ